MNLEILKKYKIKAKKSLWQNFLVNDDILNEISSFLDIKNDNIVEVWPWYWALTEKIIEKKPSSLTLVELDQDMINIINERISTWELDTGWIEFNIENIDILKYEPNFSEKKEGSINYSVIANIPYYITSPILRHFLYDIENKPEKMLILMQKDVWDKILWGKKNKSSVISLFVNKKCRVEERLFVWKENFKPMPKVESSVLSFESHKLYNEIDDDIFLQIIKIWFAEPRKKLLNNLVKWWFEKEYILIVFKKLKFENNIRWEDLNITKWCDLILEINKKLTKKTCS